MKKEIYVVQFKTPTGFWKTTHHLHADFYILKDTMYALYKLGKIPCFRIIDNVSGEVVR